MTTTTTATAPTAERLEHMYRLMALTAGTSERAAAEVRAGRLQSAFYPVRGMEGVCAALGAAMEPGDQLVSTYRNLGDALAKGASLRRIIAEVYGRSGGTSKGKGGPMHLQDTAVGFMASTGIVGAGLPIAAGLALAAQLDGADRAVVVTFGDGSTSIGAWHEAMNLAGLWKLPLLLLCQNNQWAEHTPLAESTAVTDLAAKAAAYGIPAVTVDGFDPVATYQALMDGLGRVRAGGGPVFVECVTYRLTGHSGSADYSYVPRDELAAAMERDPAPTFRRWLAEQHLVEPDRLEAIDAEVAAAVDDAFAFAEASPHPGPDERLTDIFADQRAVPTP
ncbi:MAG: thiamine pyrophosphate-dependent dehydrogenase E1 component subunit alpha [Acidimicrobiia bacterium]